MVQLTQPQDNEPIDGETLRTEVLRAEKAAWESKDEMAQAVLCEVHEALTAYRRTAEKLDEVSRRVFNEIEDLQQSLEFHGRPSNSLGALQGSGPEVDRLCGEFRCRRQALTRMIGLANKILGD